MLFLSSSGGKISEAVNCDKRVNFSFPSSRSAPSLLLMDLKHDVVYYEAESRRLRVEAEMLLRRRKNDLFNFNVEISQLRCFNVVK